MTIWQSRRSGRTGLRRAVGTAVAFFGCVVAVPASAAVNYPFGSHPLAYTAGSIRPNHVSQGTLDQAVRDFYDAWKSAYVVEACGAGRYVVESNTDAGNLTVSEAHGYGMMLTALMAGHDPDARAIFDGMYAYFGAHPTATHDHLMSWYQKRSCADDNGNDSASDGDIDIALALLLADKQWGSCGPIDYLAEAQAVIADLLDGAVDTAGEYVLLGDWVTPSDTQYYPSTRSSDFIPGHFRSFGAATSDPTWTDLVDRGYTVFDALQTNHSPSAGLLPDFILNPLTTPVPAGAMFLEGDNDGDYDYNACRDPWRVATDYLVTGDARAKTIAQRLNTFIRAATGNDPAAIRSGYQLDGSMSAGADYLSMAFVAPFGVGATVDASHQAWLNAIWDLVDGTPLQNEGYYENTLKLLGMLVMSGNWWAPEAVASGSCTPEGTALCTNGGSIPSLDIKLSGLSAPAGNEKIKVKGSLFFAQGAAGPSPLSSGAQIRIEDVGSGNAALFDLTAPSAEIPPPLAPTCDSRDGWKVQTGKSLYKNRSTALDAPTCTAGSAGGLSKLQLRQRGPADFDFKILARGAALPAIVGPVRLTLVLGSTAASSAAGECAISAAIPCVPSGDGLRCRQQ